MDKYKAELRTKKHGEKITIGEKRGRPLVLPPELDTKYMKDVDESENIRCSDKYSRYSRGPFGTHSSQSKSIWILCQFWGNKTMGSVIVPAYELL